MRLLVCLGIAAALVLAWTARFQPLPTGNSSAAYMVNRWTGAVYVITPTEYWTVKEREISNRK